MNKKYNKRYKIRITHYLEMEEAVYNSIKGRVTEECCNRTAFTQTNDIKYYNDMKSAMDEYQNKAITLMDNPKAYCPLAEYGIITGISITVYDTYECDELHQYKIKPIHPDEKVYTNYRCLHFSCIS